eukprot:gene6860-7582_t
MEFILLFFIVIILQVSSRWMHSTVSYTLTAPRLTAFNLFSSLDQHPRWSPWLEDVQYDRSTGLSVWTLSSMGLRYSWHANNTHMDPPYTIQWESLDGLPNKGKVEFLASELLSSSPLPSPSLTPHSNTHTGHHEPPGQPTISLSHSLISHQPEVITIRLTISYDLPEAAALVLRALGPVAKHYIHNTLLADLKRFHKVLNEELQIVKRNKETPFNEADKKVDHTLREEV